MTNHVPVAADPAILETGIASADMYRSSRGFLAYVQGLGLSTHGHRLLHALLHATCRDLNTWSPRTLQTEQGFRRPCIALRRMLGTEAANSNRALTAGGLELLESGLFDLLGMSHGRTWLCWRFTDAALALLLDDRRYGLFDVTFLPTLRSPLDFLVHSEVTMVRRMRRGAFTLHLEGSSPATERTWSTSGKFILAALRRSAAQQNMVMVVLLDCEGVLRGIDTVHVRTWRAGSCWTIRALGKVHATTRRCLLVDGAGHVEVATQDLEQRLREVANAGWSLDAVRS